MKLHEEFKLFESMWDDFEFEVEDGNSIEEVDYDTIVTSYPKKINGKIYDIVKADELRAAMEACGGVERAMHLKNIIIDNEACRFSEEAAAMARRVWKEYKADHNLY
jgi:hypothetical protein